MEALKKIIAITLFTLLTSSQAFSYTVFTMNRTFDWNSPTDVFVIGYGKEVGTLFLNTAVTRARKHQDVYGSDRQVLFIWAQEKSYEYDTMVVSQKGMNILYADDIPIDMSLTLDWLDYVTQITSLHFIGHSSAWNGFGLQHRVRFGQDPRLVSRLKDNFTKGAYIYLHGCNTGFVAAPEFSSIFRLPVLASLTSTDFQQLHNDGTWYWNNSGQYPRGGWRSRNDRSFYSIKSCSSYACMRMKANNHPYNGVWGKYETGLPFHKTFCNFDLSDPSAASACYEGMWNAMLTWPSTKVFDEFSSRQTYRDVVVDFLCPKVAGYSIDRTCERVLDAADRGIVSTQKFHWGHQIYCDFKKCDFATKNVHNRDGLLVTVFISEDAGNTTLAEEYQLYMELFDRYSYRSERRASSAD